MTGVQTCALPIWHEHFAYDKWLQAFDQAGIDPAEYAERQFAQEDCLPWEHIDCGVSKKWLWQEWEKAARAEKTLDCRQGPCNGCGICPALGCENRYCESEVAE